MMTDAAVWQMFSFFRHCACASTLTEAKLQIVWCMVLHWGATAQVGGGEALAG